MIILASLIVAIPPPKTVFTDNFFRALLLVEDADGPDIGPPGDGGRCGPWWGIHDEFRREANRIIALQEGMQYAPVFSDDDRNDYLACKEMVRVVLGYWSRYHRARGRNMGPAEVCSLHRMPTNRWRPKRLRLPLERERTRKLKAYMGL